MLTQELKEQIQSLYRECLKAMSLRPRYGQRHMIAAIARSLGEIHEGDDGNRDNQAGIAVVEAGTGTGKTLAYLLAALPVALAKERKLLISTATVALQEQILNKDLPALKEHPVTVAIPFTLAKRCQHGFVEGFVFLLRCLFKQIDRGQHTRQLLQ